MIDYQELADRFRNAGLDYPDVDTALSELYRAGRSLRQLAELSGGYVSSQWLRDKLVTLGVEIRPRGGANYLPSTLYLPAQEWETQTCRDLSQKYGVSRSSISKAARRLGYISKGNRSYWNCHEKD